MTIDERVEAVEAFIDWRDEQHSREPLAADLERWRTHLLVEESDALLKDLVSQAKQAAESGDKDALTELVEKIAGLDVPA